MSTHVYAGTGDTATYTTAVPGAGTGSYAEVAAFTAPSARVAVSPTDKLDQAVYDQGRQVTLTDLGNELFSGIQEIFVASATFTTTELAPLQPLPEGADHLRFSQVNFNRQLPSPDPSQATVNLQTFRQQVVERAVQRWGQQFEYDARRLFTTPEGRDYMNGMVRAMARNMQEMANIMVMLELRWSITERAVRAHDYGEPSPSLEDVERLAKETFLLARRDPNSVSTKLADVARYMMHYGTVTSVEQLMAIVSPTTLSCLSATPTDKVTYRVTGLMGGELESYVEGPVGYRLRDQPVRVRVVPEMPLDGQDPVNIMRRVVQTGEHFHVPFTGGSDYYHNAVSIGVYDEEADEFRRIDGDQLLQNMGVFQEEAVGGGYHPALQAFVEEINNKYADLRTTNEKMPPMHVFAAFNEAGGRYKLIDRLIEMDERFLTNHVLREMAEALDASLQKTYGVEQVRRGVRFVPLPTNGPATPRGMRMPAPPRPFDPRPPPPPPPPPGGGFRGEYITYGKQYISDLKTQMATASKTEARDFFNRLKQNNQQYNLGANGRVVGQQVHDHPGRFFVGPARAAYAPVPERNERIPFGYLTYPALKALQYNYTDNPGSSSTWEQRANYLVQALTGQAVLPDNIKAYYVARKELDASASAPSPSRINEEEIDKIAEFLWTTRVLGDMSNLPVIMIRGGDDPGQVRGQPAQGTVPSAPALSQPLSVQLDPQGQSDKILRLEVPNDRLDQETIKRLADLARSGAASAVLDYQNAAVPVNLQAIELPLLLHFAAMTDDETAGVLIQTYIDLRDELARKGYLNVLALGTHYAHSNNRLKVLTFLIRGIQASVDDATLRTYSNYDNLYDANGRANKDLMDYLKARTTAGKSTVGGDSAYAEMQKGQRGPIPGDLAVSDLQSKLEAFVENGMKFSETEAAQMAVFGAQLDMKQKAPLHSKEEFEQFVQSNLASSVVSAHAEKIRSAIEKLGWFKTGAPLGELRDTTKAQKHGTFLPTMLLATRAFVARVFGPNQPGDIDDALINVALSDRTTMHLNALNRAEVPDNFLPDNFADPSNPADAASLYFFMSYHMSTVPQRRVDPSSYGRTDIPAEIQNALLTNADTAEAYNSYSRQPKFTRVLGIQGVSEVARAHLAYYLLRPCNALVHWKFLMQSNVPPPLGFLLLRPHQRLIAEDVIVVKPGADTMRTYAEPALVDLQSDPRTLMILGRVSWKAAAVMIQSANGRVLGAMNGYKYLGGRNAHLMSFGDTEQDAQRAYANLLDPEQRSASIICVPIPASERSVPRRISLAQRTELAHEHEQHARQLGYVMPFVRKVFPFERFAEDYENLLRAPLGHWSAYNTVTHAGTCLRYDRTRNRVCVFEDGCSFHGAVFSVPGAAAAIVNAGPRPHLDRNGYVATA